MRWAIVCLALAGCAAEADPVEAPADALTHPQALLWRGHDVVVVEVDHVPGYAPTTYALERFIEEVQERTAKPVRLVGPHSIHNATGDPDRVWTEEARDAFVASVLSKPSAIANGRDAHLHVVFLDGKADAVRGLYLPAGNILVFPDELRQQGEYPVLGPAYEQLEHRVLVHELGHALGLVGCGIPAVKDHGDGDCHSLNGESVMFVEHALVDSRALSRGQLYVTAFDADDLADLAAFRARDPSA